MDFETKQILTTIANTIRSLSIDAIGKAKSGHPGLPLGCAEIGAYLYGIALKHNPKNTKWLNRDRFILSAGHGSMLLYSCLHLAGFDISIDDIKNFRQWNSKTPGHPEKSNYGIETTTGPLGQGFGNAVGQALGLKLLANELNKNKTIIDNKVYVLAGDGCMMEGISAEVSSLTGHLQLNNLIAIYDANNISLDGELSQSSSENIKMRYKAYSWDVIEIDGHNFDEIDNAFEQIKNQTKPVLIIAKTTIGKGSPKENSNKIHGTPLNKEEISITKKNLNIPEKDFYVPKEVYSFFNEKIKQDITKEQQWKQKINEIPKFKLPDNLEEQLNKLEIKSPMATRSISNKVINQIADLLPQLYGGSADLSCSDKTFIDKYDFIKPNNFNGRNIKYGVREFGMAAISIGLSQVDLIPFCGTFLVFSDYMRNACRMAAMQNAQVIFQFTHDSFFLGEDGPTHQPIEHLASLRAIPNLQVIRPADHNEVKMAWLAALKHKTGPTALILSRQNVNQLTETNVNFEEGVGKGAYIIKDCNEKPAYTIFASGSEVQLALKVSEKLENTRVISMPCWEIFEQQNTNYKKKILKGNIGKRISIEAATNFGWHKYICENGFSISIEHFGASAPTDVLAEKFGFTVNKIINRLKNE